MLFIPWFSKNRWYYHFSCFASRPNFSSSDQADELCHWNQVSMGKRHSSLLELTFWYCNIDWFSGYSIKPPLATHIVLFSDSSGIAFGGFSSTLDGTVMNGMWKPEDKLFIVCCFFTLLNWNTKELKSLLIIRAPPEKLLSKAPKFMHLQAVAMVWLSWWAFLISVLLTALFWKCNGFQGHLRTFAPKSSHTQIFLKLWLQVENDKIRLKT